MATTKFSVDKAKFYEVAAECGVRPIEKKNWTKFGQTGLAVYVASPKSDRVRGITVAGFEYESPIVVPPPDHNGRVTGVVDFDTEGLTEEAVLAAFRGALELMKTREPPAPRPGRVAPTPPPTDRREMIREAALVRAAKAHADETPEQFEARIKARFDAAYADEAPQAAANEGSDDGTPDEDEKAGE